MSSTGLKPPGLNRFLTTERAWCPEVQVTGQLALFVLKVPQNLRGSLMRGSSSQTHAGGRKKFRLARRLRLSAEPRSLLGQPDCEAQRDCK